MNIRRYVQACLAAGLSACAAPPAVTTLRQIPEVRAKNGIVAFDLDAVVDPATGAPAFSYRHAIGVAPTIRVTPGQEIRVTLHDRLPGGGEPSNAVNLHFHGLSVSPLVPSDDAMRVAVPGKSVAYEIHVSRDQPPGLYWYHPHVHGQSFWQITSGMSGAIVVEGLSRRLPALARMRERLIVLRNVQTPADYSTIPIAARAEPIRRAVMAARRKAGRVTVIDDDDAMGQPCAPVSGMTPEINGAPRATIGIDPGERQFFRVVNASAGRYFDLSVDGAPLELVALDGVALGAFPGSPPVETKTDIVIPPAGRAEFVVTGGERASILRSKCYASGEAGDRDPEVEIADLRPDGEAPPGSREPFSETDAQRRGASAVAARVPRVSVRREIVFSENAGGFYIDGKRYRMDGPPEFVARTGTLEEWRLINRTDEVHDFHIHQLHFAVEAIDAKSTGPLHWVDTVTVPPKRYSHTAATAGTATLLMDFRNPAIRGTFVFHCHILDHEDGGMMATIRVI